MILIFLYLYTVYRSYRIQLRVYLIFFSCSYELVSSFKSCRHTIHLNINGRCVCSLCSFFFHEMCCSCFKKNYVRYRNRCQDQWQTCRGNSDCCPKLKCSDQFVKLTKADQEQRRCIRPTSVSVVLKNVKERPT